MADDRRSIAAGAIVGLLVGGGLIAFVNARSRADSPGDCPAGWSIASAPDVPGAHALAACSRPPVVPASTAPWIAVYRANGEASTLADSAVRAVGDARRVFVGSPPAGDPPSRDSATAPALEVVSRTATRDVPLLADVYFVAAGHRFGLLSIVHAPDAPFARPEATAAWMGTFTGTSPWGSPDAGPLVAHCPEGFAPQPTQALISCVRGTDSLAFAALTMSVNDGGFATDDERRAVAGVVARVAQAHGAQARVTAGPEAFTLARNVDALHASVETGEHTQVQTQVLAVYADGPGKDTLGLAVFEGDDDAIAPLRALATPAGLAHRRGPLGMSSALALTALLAAIGAALGAALRRP